jgi:hypothetical protein
VYILLGKLQFFIQISVVFNKTITINFIFEVKQLRKYLTHHIKWVPCHHGMARPQVADGGNALQFWREAANILDKQSWTADQEWSSSMEVGRRANNSSP